MLRALLYLSPVNVGERITPKFSFHTTQYAQYRPNVLGSSLAEQMLKDYNGQTYWLSIYTPSIKAQKPKWLNYGSGWNGMLTGNKITGFFDEKREIERFYLSFVDLTKIDTKSCFF
jgi:hypothetical protein